MNEYEYLAERLDDQITWYDEKSQTNQKWFKRLKLLEELQLQLFHFWQVLAQPSRITQYLLVLLVSLLRYLPEYLQFIDSMKIGLNTERQQSNRSTRNLFTLQT